MPSIPEIVTRSAEETIRAGRELGGKIVAPILVLLSGELGAGKTTFAKGLISGLGAAREDEVTSPTFTLVHQFRSRGVGTTPVFHIDLYRIERAADLESLGLEDLFAAPAVVLVEWPEKWTLQTGWPVLRIRFDLREDMSRRIRIAEAEAVTGVEG